MEAKELRIGNWVSDIHASDKAMWQVTEIKKEVCIYGARFQSKYYNLRPAPLSISILERCGFTENKMGVLAIEINDIATHLELMEANGMFYPSIDQMQDIGEPQNVALNSIQYLHELQNLYYALTKTDLIYQP